MAGVKTLLLAALLLAPPAPATEAQARPTDAQIAELARTAMASNDPAVLVDAEPLAALVPVAPGDA